MMKKLLSAILAAALLVTAIPATAFAEADSTQSETPAADAGVPGDVNGDNTFDLKDVLLLKKQLNEEQADNFQKANADVNGDGEVDEADYLIMKAALADDDLKLDSDLASVSFYDGSRLIDVLTTKKGEKLGAVPDVSKSSKANAILIGYYTDEACTTPFYAENPVEGSIKVYAKYEETGEDSTLTVTSFAQMDQDPDVSFEIQQVSGDVPASEAAALAVKDGSEAVALSVADEDNDGVYTVKADGGFREGCSYEITLADGWVFKDKEDTIRTASFTIQMDEVENLQMSDEIKYIRDTEDITYRVDEDGDGVLEENEEKDTLTPALVSEYGQGSFTYSGAASLQKGDILCFYLITNPAERDYTDDKSYTDDPEVYVKVTAVSDATVSFSALEDKDVEELYEVPDNFPLKADAVPAASTESGTINISKLDTKVYAQIVTVDGVATPGDEELLAKAKSAVNVGDFITIYTELDTASDAGNAYYGKVTAYNTSTGEITYAKSSAKEIESCMDLYITPALSGDDILSDESKEEMEEQILEQVEESDFANEAVKFLAALATETDSFKESVGVTNYELKKQGGTALTSGELDRFLAAAKFKPAEDVELTVEIKTKGDDLHFKDKGSVQLTVGVKASIETETADDGKVMIDLSAAFVEEMALGINVKGELVKKKILGIPIPTGVCVSANIDLYNYTSVNFNVNAYTAEAEEKGFLDKFKAICKDPVKNLGLALPDELSKGLNTVGDALDKIDELQKKIDKAKKAKEKVEGYEEDIEALWAVVESSGTTQETVNGLFDTLKKTNLSEDLMDLMGLTTETGISSGRYADSLEALLQKYSDMLKKETGWVELVNKSLAEREFCYCGVAIAFGVNFVVRMDTNIAMGSSIEYEVGKRYTFWFKVGLFKWKTGSSTMDLVDEQFAFQFYVMGKLGLKMGVEGKFNVGLGSTKFASVGIHLELGPYVKLYGFFLYDYSRTREPNTTVWVSDESMAGALCLEFGLYVILGADANLIGNLFEWSGDFIDEEFPLLDAGDEYYPYKFTYEPDEDMPIFIKDEDADSTNGITMQLPDCLRTVSRINLKNGQFGGRTYSYNDYYITLSNPNFTLNNGVVTVTPADGEQYMECDLTFTYKYGKMAFCDYDMTVTIPLVWTNLTTEEQKETYTANVRVGNAEDGYETVWAKTVKKNQSFDLPTLDKVKELAGYSSYKYESFSNYAGARTGLRIYENKTYDIEAELKEYKIDVTDVQSADGTTGTRTFTARFGEGFDFTALETTGTSIPGKTYTKYLSIETSDGTDLTEPISETTADGLTGGTITAKAVYADDSVTATFTFDGIEHGAVSQKVKKGTKPSLSLLQEEIGASLAGGAEIAGISPELGRISADTDYVVTCGFIEGEERTITFDANGGSAVDPAVKKAYSLIGELPAPTRGGYEFAGWYTDDGTFANAFEDSRMPDHDVTLYAKWTAGQYKVTFNVYGGNELDDADKTKTVTYGDTYGTLPTPTRSGYRFAGWFTEADGETEVTADTTVEITDAQTLYAHWAELPAIPTSVFDFGNTETFTYEKGVARAATYTFTPEEGASYAADEFTVQYKLQSGDSYIDSPVGAGTYDVKVSRPADGSYGKFEHLYTAALKINKATRDASHFENAALVANVTDPAFDCIDVQLDKTTVEDLDDAASVVYIAKQSGSETEAGTSEQALVTEAGCIRGLELETAYQITAKIVDDPNYEDFESDKVLGSATTLPAPTGNWTDEKYVEKFTIDDTAMTISISTAGQLAYLAKMVVDNSYAGYTITLTNDVDLRAHVWVPIGGNAGCSFSGVFDGGQHTITGLYTSGYAAAGLFGYVNAYNGGIKNLILDKSYVSGNNDETNSTTQGTGGIVGAVCGGQYDISQCVNKASVHGLYSTGGIVGYFAGRRIVNCVNYGSVDTTNMTVGGIVGNAYKNKSVINCANRGAVSGQKNVGGIAGYSDSFVKNCYSIGKVTGTTTTNIGAVVGALGSGYSGAVANPVYYLKDSASAAAGYGSAAATYSYFTSPTDQLVGDTTYGKTNLKEALNGWVNSADNTYDALTWVSTGTGYPLPIDWLK